MLVLADPSWGQTTINWNYNSDNSRTINCGTTYTLNGQINQNSNSTHSYKIYLNSTTCPVTITLTNRNNIGDDQIYIQTRNGTYTQATWNSGTANNTSITLSSTTTAVAYPIVIQVVHAKKNQTRGFSLTIRQECNCSAPSTTYNCTNHGGTEYTIGNGTSYSNTYGPVNANWCYSYRQILYTTTELGSTAGTIRAIGFQHQDNNSITAKTNVVVYMANTALTEFGNTTWQNPGYTQVYSGSMNFSGNGWAWIELQTPFNYSGGSLIVAIDDNSGNYDGNYNFYYHSKTNSQLYYQNDTQNPTHPTPSPTATRDSYRPNTKFCIESSASCPPPTNVTVSSITDNSAQVSWTGSAEANSYNVRWTELDNIATITLTVGDVWGDGSGYQMLLDANATAYGTAIPETGALTNGGDVPAATYAQFEYKIPSNADGALNTSNMVVDNSVTIIVPAGTYDWCITNPTPGDRVWIASTNGNVGGRADNYVFEGGKNYEFVVSRSGENDQVNVTISQITSLPAGVPLPEGIPDHYDHLVTGVAGSPYTITGLDASTVYAVQVQADCGGGDESTWSTPEVFITQPCPEPTNVTITDITNNTATVNWSGSADSYNIRWFEATDPTVTLTAGDVWGDGSGYQMLIDADANTYGATIPATGALTGGGDVPAATYAEFEYKIPTNADGSLTTTNIVFNTSITITVPAGTYDWCITNPTPGDRMWIASGEGNIGGRADDFVIEAGFNYEFVVTFNAVTDNDQTNLTILPISTVHTANGVTGSQYTMTGLTAGTTYIVQVQSNCGGSQSNWSDPENFTTCNLDAEIQFGN